MISIIIPFCNEVPQILFTAQSLCEQLRNIECEILLIDNRSAPESVTDFGQGAVSDENYFLPDTPKESFECYSKSWIHKTKQRDFFKNKPELLGGRIKYFTYDQKLSHWNAKNFGVSKSQFPYILFLDAHCIISPQSIQKMLEFLKNPPNENVGAVHCLINYMLDAHSLEYKLIPERFCYRFTGAQKQSIPYEVPIMSTCGMMMNRVVFDQIGGWNSELGIYGGGEAYMGFKLATCGYSHWIHPEAICWHYAESRGYSWNLWDWIRNNFIAAFTVGGESWLERLNKLFQQENHPREILDKIAEDIQSKCRRDREIITQNQKCSYDEFVDRWTKNKPVSKTVKKSNEMVTVIIPAQNENNYLNQTIENVFSTAEEPVEIIVLDNGGNGKIDKRARIRQFDNNVGERASMNFAARKARGKYLLRIDAHCNFPKGWDVKMKEVTGEKDITVAVLGAITPIWEHVNKKRREKWLASGKKPEDWQAWQKEKGHWYGLCRIIISEDEQGNKGLECKWQKPNRDHSVYKTVEPNMGLTGCGFMLRKSFYEEIGGADESLPKMGAIGEEFALKAWAAGGKVQTRTDVMIGHVWGTGGYDTSGVKVAQQKLWLKYQNIYPSIVEKFPNFENMKLVRTDQPGKQIRTVTVDRTDNQDTKDKEGKLIRRKVEKFRYVWLESEHPEDKDLTQKQIEEKYASKGTKIGEQIIYADEKGELVPV